MDGEACPACGETKPTEIRAQDYGLTDKYSTIQWLGAIIFAFLTFPIGLVIPGYFYYKCRNGGALKQGALETWTVIFTGIFGIVAVELGGKKGAKILWGTLIALIGIFGLLAL